MAKTQSELNANDYVRQPSDEAEAYVSGTPYAVDSWVSFKGGIYLCKKATDGTKDPTDTEYWSDLTTEANKFSTSNGSLIGTITATVPATAMRMSADDPEVYVLRTGAADPWDGKLDTTSTADTWIAGPYSKGEFVSYQGKSYMANLDAVSGDVPGVSAKWTVANYPALFSRNGTSEVSVQGVLENVELEKCIIAAVSGNFTDAENTSY